jgi:hypothetical protein
MKHDTAKIIKDYMSISYRNLVFRSLNHTLPVTSHGCRSSHIRDRPVIRPTFSGPRSTPGWTILGVGRVGFASSKARLNLGRVGFTFSKARLDLGRVGLASLRARSDLSLIRSHYL